jgi:hypothetical protein
LSKKLSILLACLAPLLHAGTVTLYNNFSENPSDPGYAYKDPVYGYDVDWMQDWHWPSDGIIRPFAQTEAMPFTPGQNAYLQSIALAMYKWPDNTPVSSTTSIATNHDNLTIELVDSIGNLPNESAVIEVLAVDPVINEDDTTFLYLNSALQPLLLQGHTYWVIAKPTVTTTADTSDNTVYAWIQNNEGAMWNYTANQFNPFIGTWTGYFSQSSSFLAPTLRVVGSDSQVPEPAYSGVLCLLLMTVYTWSWRKGAGERRIVSALRSACKRRKI